MKTLKKRTWKEFRQSGMLWFVNRILHLFGWVIVFDYTGKNKIKSVYPARTIFRGFSEDCETKGFKQVTKYLGRNVKTLLKETEM